MLQQTQVKTALAYYERFLRSFPTIEALDRASVDEVLTVWSGLGYYRRAENLKKAARQIMREHGGKIPPDFRALRALPGVGPYTAGALMSIGFNRVYPALDGNARRVLARLFNANGEKELHAVSKRLVPRSRPGHFNQALMELGSKICVARDPRCPTCPIGRSCAARRSGKVEVRVPASAKPGIKKVEWPLVLVQNKGKILLRRRPSGGMLGGLWELPGGERKKGEALADALARHLNGLGDQVSLGSPIGEIRHSITRHRIRAPLFVSVCSSEKKIRLPRPRWRWLALSRLHRYPLSALSRKAITLLARR
jgi:A/G-specific adenine glycosylase